MISGNLEYLFDRGQPCAHLAEAVVPQRDHALPRGQFADRLQRGSRK